VREATVQVVFNW